MTNAKKFQEIFKKFATEVWAFPEKDFLTWLNAEYKEPATKNEAKYCDRNICLKNEYNNIGCEDCEVTESQKSITNDLVPRKVVERIIKSPRTQEQMLLMLNSVPSVMSQDPRWISVDERLPEKNIACLVKVGKSNLTQMAVYSDLMGTIDHRIFYQGEKEDGTFVNITKYVNAWMPLSSSYER